MINQNQILSRSLHFCLIILLSLVILTPLSTPFATLAHSADVTLGWSPVTDADGYSLYYGFESRNYEVSTDVGDQTSYTLSDLDPGTYYFAVTSWNNYGESSYSEELPYTIEDPGPATHSITASAGTHGVISPSGTVSVNHGSDQTFIIITEQNYHVADILVDGSSVGALTSYSFSNVTQGHTIVASFAVDTVVTHSITASAGAHGSISPSGTVTVNHGSNKTFTITPDKNYHVADILVDGSSVGALTSYSFSNVTQGHTIVASFSLDNQPPIADAGPDQTVGEGAIVTLNGHNSTDPNSNIASYSWEQTDGQTVALLDPTEAETTFMAPDVGTDGDALIFRLTVNDDDGSSSSDSCIINVSSLNAPPTAKAGPDQTANEGDIVTLDGSNSEDPDNNIVSYLWEQKAGPDVELSDTTAVQATFTSPDVGTDGTPLTFQLIVEDSGGLKATDTCIVNVVWLNTPPVANAGPDQTGSEGSEITLDGSKSIDTDDGIDSFRWTQTTGHPVTLSGPTEVNPTFKIPDGGQEGASLGFQLTVTDNGGLEGTDRCNVNVTSTKPLVLYIKANGQDSPITLSTGTSLEISVHLDPGDYAGQLADWWVVVHIPSDPPFDWAHYKWLGERKQARRLGRWKNGVELSRQAPLYNISQQVLRTKWLPPGDYIFYFAVDNNADGKPDATWLDYVEVTIQ